MKIYSYFLKAIVLSLMIGFSVDYLLPTPENLSFQLLRGVICGTLIALAIQWFLEIPRKQINNE